MRDRLELVVREESGRLIAALVHLLGDWDLAEEMVQDAVVAALEHWSRDGIPDNPGAWLMTTSRRKALDRLRRDALFNEKLSEFVAGLGGDDASGRDDRLRLIFTCCHPALGRDAQVALTLRTVGGLHVSEIARAFIAPEATIAQRISRAKKKIREEKIPYRVPQGDELPERLGYVLAVLYLIFNEGYLATSVSSRPDLASEAERLTSMLASLMPSEPEALGLLALMRLHLARSRSRFGPYGSLILLENQDRSLWDREAIAEATELLARARRAGRPGAYQVQAAIAAVHARADSFEETDWNQIVALYEELHALTGSPVVVMNHAVAVAHASTAVDGLRMLDACADALADYQPYHATRAELLRRAGRLGEARESTRRALELTTNPAQRELLTERLDRLR